MKIDSGIYKFQNKANGKVYIGQSKYLGARYRQHKSELLRGTHHNKYFQNEVNAYGFDSFDYSVVRRCDVSELDFWEDYYFKEYDSTNRKHGYNMREAGNESNMPEEVKHKISVSNRGKNSKLNVADVEEIKIKRLAGWRCCDLAKLFGVTISTINKITMCKNWAYVRGDLNERLLRQARDEADITAGKIKELYRKGNRPSQITRALGVSANVVNRVLADDLDREKEMKRLVVEDFMNMKKPGDIVADRGVTYSQYRRLTAGLRHERDLIAYKRIVKMKNDGVMVKDIADSLNINRSTVNDICKRFSDYANTEATKD